MDIWMIWGSQVDFLTLEEAWDDDLKSADPEGFEAAIKKAQDEYGASNVRVFKTRIDFGPICDAFNITPEVASGPVVAA